MYKPHRKLIWIGLLSIDKTALNIINYYSNTGIVEGVALVIHKNIYSRRIRKIEKLDPYIYNFDGTKVRTSFLQLFAKFRDEDFLFTTVRDFCETKGEFLSEYTETWILNKSFYDYNYLINDIKNLLEEYEAEDILDFIDISICVINNDLKSLDEFIYSYHDDLFELTDLKERYIYNLNETLEHNNLGFTVINDIVVTKESDFLHQEAIVKPLTLLVNEEFSGPVEEFQKAIAAYTKKDYENTIIEACKAYESTMKSILDKLKSTYQKDKSTAKSLLAELQKVGIFDPFLDNMFNNLNGILVSSLPTIRNKKSGHGDGIDIDTVERSYASYALNLAGSSIVFLLDRYYEKSSN